MLIETKDGGENQPAPLRLEHLTVQHNLTGTIHGQDGPSEKRFSMVALNVESGPLIEVFLRFSTHFLGSLADNPAPREVAHQLRRLVEMLQNLRQPGLKTVQGLWAELLLIHLATNPSPWVEAWHSDPLELHDFCFNGLRLEVKSSSSRIRKHFFSHLQLCSVPGSRTIIASTFVERSSSGISALGLAFHIRQYLEPENSLRLDEIVIATLGSSYLAAEEFKFDSALAKASLKFFDLEKVPRLPEDLPERVSDLSHASLLDDADECPLPDFLS